VVADWRVTVQLHSASGDSRALLRGPVAHGIRDRLGQLVAVSEGDSELFVYADTAAAASEAAQAARELIGSHRLPADVRLERWHPLKAEWADDTEGALLPAWQLAEAEHQRRVAEDTQKSETTGVARWTVRIALSSRHDAMQLAGQLNAEGVPAVRRRKSVLLGASNEDEARELAQRVGELVPAADVRLEQTFVWSPPVDFGSF
jgi:hypothetical protein